ncbi:MAG: contractile injection system tape measure protein [Bacteroidota bacterium]
MDGGPGRADMVALLTGTLRNRGETVRARLKKTAQKNRELPSLISSILGKQDFAHFFSAWFESDWAQWEKILKDTGFAQERYLFSISYLLRAEEIKPEAFIYATVSSVNIPDRDEDAFWHYLETGIISAGWKDITGANALEILMSDTADGGKLLQKIRRSYSRSRATLTRLLELLNQEDVYKLVGKLTDVSPERWTALNDLLEEYRTDTARTNLLPLLLLKNIIAQTWTDKNAVISQIRRELEAGEISDTSEGRQNVVAATRIWTWLESGRFDEGLFQLKNSDRELFLEYILRSGRELTLGRLREMYSTRPGFVARFVTLFNQEGQRRFIAHILGLDLAAWQVLEEHMAGEVKLKNEDILSASLRYMMSIGSMSGEELLSGVIQELERFATSSETAGSGRLDEHFWSYLEFGSYPVTVRPISRREGSRIVDQWIQSGNTYNIRRLSAIFKRESAVLLRLAAITGIDTRRRLISTVLGTELAAVRQAERIRFRSAGNISPEDTVAAMLRLVLSGNVTSMDALKLALEYESGLRVSRYAELNSAFEKEYLLWYFLEQGRYPQGMSSPNSQELSAILLNQLAIDNSGTVQRLRELFRYHPALMLHLSKIFDIYQLRQLVAGMAGAVLNEWIIWEDVIRSGSVAVYSPVRFQTAALGFLLSGAAVDISTLASLMSAYMGLEEPESPIRPGRYDAEYPVWFFLEYGHHPSGTNTLSPDQFYSVLRAMSSDHPERVAKRLRQIYIRTPEIILRIGRIFDSARLRTLLSVWLNLGPSDWKEVQRLFSKTGKVRTTDYGNPDVMILKWWLAGEIRGAESLLSILRDLLPSPGAKTEILAGTRSPQQIAMWFYLEYGRFPAGSAILTEEELATMILSAIEHDREDTLYRFRDLYRRNPAFLLRINRPGTEIVSSIISRLLDISDEKLASVISYLGEEGGPDKPDTELVLYALLRMIMSGEIENKSDIERLTERKGSDQPSRVADISPVYQLWYYLDQGKRLAGSIPQNQMATILLEASRTNRAATVRQLRDLNSHSAGLFLRLVGLLSPANLKALVFTLLNLGENDWKQLVQLPVWATDIPDDNRLLTDLLRATLQGRLDEKSDIIEYLRQLPEYAPVDQYAPADQYSPEALMWYYLDSGRYPPGVLPLSDEELSGVMLQIAAMNSKETRLRLHELYKRRSGLLLKLSGILHERARRNLVARLTNLTDTEWSKIEDVLRVNTGQLTGKIVNDTLRYLLTGTVEINADLLQELTGFIGRQSLPDSARPSEDDYLWYFLENGRLFDAHSPDIQQLGERLITLWRLSPGRTAAHWKTVAAKTDLNNRLRQYYNRVLLEQIIRARYESTQVDLDLMAVDLLIFSPSGRRKISVVKIWDLMVSVLLPQLHLVKHPYFIFEELLLLLSQHYHVDQSVMAHYLTKHPQVSQAGRKYALRASGAVTQPELVLLTGAIESKTGYAPDESDFPDNSYLTLLASELRSVQELFSGALRWSDMPDASGTIAWLLKVAEKPVLQVVKTLLRDEWIVSRAIKNIPPDVAEIIQGAIATDKWHEFLSVRDEAVYYFDLILQEHLIRHFNEAFFRISAGADSVPSLDKTVELFLDRIVIHEHVTMSDLSGALKGKNTIGQGVLFRYIQKKYARKESSVKPVLELVREASVRVDDAVYIFNAGLVILHPYLSRYFDVLGLMEGKEFRDEESADRAVHLLQYLATRQTETPEYMLVLNKILCGLPVDMPVTPGIIMTDNEVEVSESLLRGVLQNWKRMENSSIDNLSGAFLVREGRLIEKEDRWSLHVKSRAYDILLEFMPWGFSRIKLSWMPKRIDVEWKTKA